MAEKIGTTQPIVGLIDAFSAEIIYTLSFEIASYVFFFSLILTVIASKIRVIQNTMESIDNGGNIEKMLADILGYTALLVMYFIVIDLIIVSINMVTTYAESIGSLEIVTNRMEILFKAAKLNNDDDGWFMSLGIDITKAIGWIFFYFSLLVLTIAILLMRFAQGAILGISFIWGLIAIPLSIVSGYKPLKGWLHWLLIGAFWPFIEAIMMIFISGSFFGSSIAIVETGSSMAVTGLYFMFTSINMLLFAAVVASPFITNSLIKGDGSIVSTVMPFATAAAAIASGATSKLINGSKKGSRLLGKRVFNGGKKYFSKESKSKEFNRVKKINEIRKNRNQQPNNNSKNNNDPASAAKKSSKVKRSKEQQKQRKGVMINKNKSGAKRKNK